MTITLKTLTEAEFVERWVDARCGPPRFCVCVDCCAKRRERALHEARRMWAKAKREGGGYTWPKPYTYQDFA